MTEATTNSPTPQAPSRPNPANASEAAALLLQWLPRIQNPDDKTYYYGYHKDGKPAYIPMSLDRSFVTGTLHGISEGRVAIGDKALLASLNNAFIKPLEAAIAAASKPSELTGAMTDVANQEVAANRRLLNTALNGIDWAASFGIFSDQPLQVARGKMTGAGFTATERKR